MLRPILLWLPSLLICVAVTAGELIDADSALMRGDYDAAVKILQERADTGDVSAMVRLGNLYQRGEGIDRDIDKAVVLFLSAAESGHAEAQFNLGNMYLLGEGVPLDEAWALTFYRLAAKQGHELADRNMRELARANGFDIPKTDAPAHRDAMDDVGSTQTVAPEPSVPQTLSVDSIESVSGPAAQSVVAVVPVEEVADIDVTHSAEPTNEVLAQGAEKHADDLAVTDGEIDPLESKKVGGQTITIDTTNELSDTEVIVEDGDQSPPIKAVIATEEQIAEARRTAAADVSAATPMITPEPIERPAEETVMFVPADEAQALRLAEEHGIEVQLAKGSESPPTEVATAFEATVLEEQVHTGGLAFADRFERAERAFELENYEHSRELLERLSTDGYAPAALLLAEMAERGQGMSADASAAMLWRQRAAKLGSSQAQYQLAELHRHGDGIESDEAMAITFYRDAARGGHELAKEKLRLIYADAGLPVPDFDRPNAPYASQVQTALEHKPLVDETVSIAADVVPEHGDEETNQAVTEVASELASQGVSDDHTVREISVPTERRSEQTVPLAMEVASQTNSVPDDHGLPAISVPIIVEDSAPEIRTSPPFKLLQPTTRLSKPDIAVEGPPQAIGLMNDAEPSEFHSAAASPRAASTLNPAEIIVTPPAETQILSEQIHTTEPALATDDEMVSETTPVVAAPQPVPVPDTDNLPIEPLSEPIAELTVAEYVARELAVVVDDIELETPSVSDAETKLADGVDLSGVADARTPSKIVSVEPVGIASVDEAEALRLAKQHGIEVELDDGSSLPAETSVIPDDVAVRIESEPEVVPVAKQHGIEVELGEDSGLPAEAPAVSDKQASTVESDPDEAAFAKRLNGAKQALLLENFAHGINRLKQLSDEGYAPAALLLADMAAHGDGMAADAEEAMSWRQRAAVLGSPEAQYQLAEMYMHGRGVEPDEAMAITFYRDAARGGHEMANEKLRLIYADAGLPMPDFSRPRKPIAIYAPMDHNAVTGGGGQDIVSAGVSTNSEMDESADEGKSSAQIESVIADRETESSPGIESLEAPTRTDPTYPPATSTSDPAFDAAIVEADPINHDPSSDEPLTELIVPELVGAESIAVFENAPSQQSDVLEEELESPQNIVLSMAAPTADVVPSALDPAVAVTATVAAGAAAQTSKGFFGRIKGLFSRENDNSPNAVIDERAASESAMEPVATTDVVVTEPQSPAVDGGDGSLAAVDSDESRSFDSMTAGSDDAEQPTANLNDPVELEGETSAVVNIAGDSLTPANTGAEISAPLATIDDGKRALADGRFADALEIFTGLADTENAEAQAHLGYMYYKGEGVEADPDRAVDWYRRAAVLGNRDAQYNLAVAYAFGEGVAQDDTQAVRWYRHAAEQGSAIAQYSLGVSYALGEGVVRDDSQATIWYRAAAEQGYAAAQYNLGYSYRTGNGIDADDAEAMHWFTSAARNGHAAAQYSLGYMFRSGRGVTRDLNEAIKWYRLAAAQGHPDARADLASLDTDDS